MGNRYSGTVGKQVTAASWKGRGYLKKYTKPSNPNTVNQQRVRGYFAAAVAAWKALTAAQKSAYGDKARADKTSVSGFNTMVSSYVKILEAGDAYTAPSEGTITVKDSDTGNPIEGATILTRKQGQSTDYQQKTTDALGQDTAALCEEDENYDMFFIAPGYTTYSTTNQTAADLWPTIGTVGLAPV